MGLKLEKTKYTGVFFRETEDSEKVFYIRYKKFGSDDYIKEKVINSIDNNILELKKYNTYSLSKEEFTLISNLIEEILITSQKPESKKLPIHFLYDPLYKAVKNINTSWGDPSEILKVNAARFIFEKTIQNLHIIELVKKDEQQRIARARDKHKIEDSINLLLHHSDDENLKYYLSKNKYRQIN